MRVVLLAIADWADDDGKAYPSVPTIANKCEMSERSVQRHIRTAEAKGWLKIQQRWNESSLYTLALRGDNLTGVTNEAEGGDSGVTTPVTEVSPYTSEDTSVNTLVSIVTHEKHELSKEVNRQLLRIGVADRLPQYAQNFMTQFGDVPVEWIELAANVTLEHPRDNAWSFFTKVIRNWRQKGEPVIAKPKKHILSGGSKSTNGRAPVPGQPARKLGRSRK